MAFNTMTFFGLAAAALAASTALSSVPASAQAQRLGQYGEDAGAALNRHLRTLADQPRNVPALMGAGKAALKLGDAQAALTFFARAEEIAPRDGRVKAGMGSAFLQMEQPLPAMKFFNDAAGLGVPEAEFAGDRGLAFDLAGDPRRAQADYAMALRRGEDPEIRRRLALSHAISGDRATALMTIDAQLRSQDRAAWRTRAFILALTGDPAEATRTTQTVMPGLAAQMSPFYAKLPSLNPAQRAMAVHFGHMPAGVQPIQTAGVPVQSSSAAAVQRAPVVAAASDRRQPPRASTTTPTSRPPARRDAAAPPARSGRSALMRERLGLDTRDERRSAARKVEQPTRVAARTETRAVSNPPAAAPAPDLAPASQPAQIVPRAVPTPAPLAQAPALQSSPPVQTPAVQPMASAQRGIAPVQLAPSSVVAPAPGFAAAAIGNFASAAPEQPSNEREATPAPAFSEIAAVIAKLQPETPPVEASPAPTRTQLAQAEIRAVPSAAQAASKSRQEAPPRAAPKEAPVKVAAKKEEPAKKESTAKKAERPKKAAPAKPAAPKEPSRIWVQVAGGADKSALPREYARLKDKAPKLFAGHSAWTTPLRFTNRLLVGPFKSEKEAQAFVNELNKLDFTAFSWTSPAGQEIEKLALK